MVKAYNQAKRLIDWPEFINGTLVWLKQPQLGKLLPRSIGPFPIVSQTPRTVKLRTASGLRTVSKMHIVPVEELT